MSMTNQTQSLHYFFSFGVLDRVDTLQLDNMNHIGQFILYFINTDA